MQTNNYLADIVKRKQTEVLSLLTQQLPNNAVRKRATSFAAALTDTKLAVIAEIKRRSPSRGQLSIINDPVKLALSYCQGGAAAISVLTDQAGFGGSLEDLQQVSAALAVSYPTVPVLRKDFIIHPAQLIESVYYGADCVLLIASLLKDQLRYFIDAAAKLGLETLTEVHDEEDLAYARAANAPIIGINHRNLKTFQMDMTLTQRLRTQLPEECITVAESGITSVATAHAMHSLGYNAVLVGETLVTANAPAALIAKMRG